MYNCAAVYVTKYLSAIWHAILDNFRPITIWGLDLMIFYVFLPGSGFGEQWLSSSYLQLGGLVVSKKIIVFVLSYISFMDVSCLYVCLLVSYASDV